MKKSKNHISFYKSKCDKVLAAYALLDVLKNTEQEPYDFRIVKVTKGFELITSLSSAQLVGKTAKQLFPWFNECWSEIFQNLHQVGDAVRFRQFFQHEGKYFQILVFHFSPDQIIMLFTEIVPQAITKDVLHIHQILFENAQDIVLYVRADGQIVDANRCACEKYGYSKQELLTLNIQDIRHPSVASEYERQMHQADIAGTVFEAIHVRRDGSSFPVEVSVKSTHTEQGHFRIHIIRDITKRKENEERISWLAKYDGLTGIPNRSSFIMKLEQEILRAKRTKEKFAVMLFDIDKFKNVNDHYGHEAGDTVLCHVAAKAQQTIRSTDHIGRFGGDEFVVLQTGIKSHKDVEPLVKRIQEAVSIPVNYKGVKISVKVSVGICIFPDHAQDTDNLLHYADTAMYQAKKERRGSYAFYAG